MNKSDSDSEQFEDIVEDGLFFFFNVTWLLQSLVLQFLYLG